MNYIKMVKKKKTIQRLWNGALKSHLCTQLVQYSGARMDDFASIVTMAWFEEDLISAIYPGV